MLHISKNNQMTCLFVLLYIFSSCKDGNKENPYNISSGDTMNIEKKWELPGNLKEVSGIAYLDDKRIACVQDEKGSIFIYNLETSEIENKIGFGKDGDYEGLVVVRNDAYVLRSDGTLFLVKDFQQNPYVQEYSLGFPASQNLEGLAYDPTGNQLLIVGKGDDPAFSDRKGIYAFNLQTKTRDKNPVTTIDLTDNHFAAKGKKNKNNLFQPSDIGVHPITKEYYILDRAKKQLLIMTKDGAIQKLVNLDANLLQAPEGIDFSKTGEIYISNEFTKDKPANIIKLRANYFVD